MLIEVNPEDAVELAALPEGEYKVKCLKAEYMEGDSWNAIKMLLEPIDHPEAKLINHMLWLPQKDDDDARRKQTSTKRLEYACTAFGVGFPKFQDTDFTNQEAWALLSVEETEDYGEQNKVKRFVGPVN